MDIDDLQPLRSFFSSVSYNNNGRNTEITNLTIHIAMITVLYQNMGIQNVSQRIINSKDQKVFFYRFTNYLNHAYCSKYRYLTVFTM